MSELSDQQIKELELHLRKRMRKWSEKGIQGVVKTINQIRNGTLKLTDEFIPNVCTYEDFILDEDLQNFLKDST